MSSHVVRVDQPSELTAQLAQSNRLVKRGMRVIVLGLLPVLAWLALAPLASSVVATAHVKVDQDRRAVQHAEGGIVREVRVRDGQQVRQGEVLLVLGDMAVDVDHARLAHRVLAERAGLARLEAEQAGAAAPAFPPDLLEAGRQDPRLREQLSQEQSLFSARRDGLLMQGKLLRAQRGKVLQEVASLRAQIDGAQESLRHQQTELLRHRQLVKEGFIAEARVSQLEGTVADYRVRLEERRSELARAEQRLVDTDLRLRGQDGDYRQQASDQLKVASLRLAELEQELRKSVDAARRQVITAPVAGEVMNLRFTTEGTVVGPRESIVDIVPANPRLVVEAQIRPEDASRVVAGQPARIRLTAFNPLTTPQVHGKVTYTSADRMLDRSTGQPFYTVQVEADAASLKAAGRLQLQPGMPAEVYLEGEARTALHYLVEPLWVMWSRAGRER